MAMEDTVDVDTTDAAVEDITITVVDATTIITIIITVEIVTIITIIIVIIIITIIAAVPETAAMIRVRESVRSKSLVLWSD